MGEELSDESSTSTTFFDSLSTSAFEIGYGMLGAEEAGCGDHDAAVDRAIVDRALRSVRTSLLLKPA